MSGEIQLEELTKAFGEHVAVAGIDLDMPAGEFFTLLGPSGCGKTTTLRMIAGFEQPTSGRIMLDGSDVARVPPHRRNVNTVFQSYALFPHLDVAKNVAFGLKYKKVDKSERAKRVAAGARARQPDRVRAAARPTSSPAASSSGWRWRARWCSSRACCCSTSRSARSTRSSARTSRSSSRRCSRSSGSRSCSSPTIRRRRSR